MKAIDWRRSRFVKTDDLSMVTANSVVPLQHSFAQNEENILKLL
jgi:hypothetical protein